MKRIFKVANEQTKGFTLIEMLVVVVIIGILGAIAAPGWLSFLMRQKMGAVNSDLMSLMREAQADAIQQRTDRDLTMSSLGDEPSVTVSNPTATAGGVLYTKKLGTDATELQLAAFSLNSSGDWVPVSTTDPIVVTFDHKGAVSTTTPYIIKVEPQNPALSISPKCVIVTTLLGGLKSEQGDACNTFAQ